MDAKDNKMGSGNSYNQSKGTGTGIIVFLSILAILLAVGAGILLRQVLSAKHNAQVAAIEINELSRERQELLTQLDELDAKYVKLTEEYAELEALFAAERRRVNQLRAQVTGGAPASGTAPNIAELRLRIQELEAQLETYRMQVDALEDEKVQLSGENAQIRATLAQTTTRNQQLETKNQELEEQLEKASLLTIANLEGVALRERRRGDEVTDRAKRADKLRVCFTINENLVAAPGNKDFFIRLVTPQNQVLTSSPDNTIVFEGETIQYSLKRTINYQNNSQEVCVVWSQGENFTKGYYNVVVFFDGREVGYKLFQLN